MRSLLLALTGLALVVPGGFAREAPKRHDLQMTWTVKKANAGYSKDQLDEFTGEGTPFGTSRVTTVTPAAERQQDHKHPRLEIENKRGWVAGKLDITKTVLKTTKTYQKVRYEGTGTITHGSSSSRYNGAEGKLTSVMGTTVCRSSGSCTGTFTVEGWVRY